MSIVNHAFSVFSRRRDGKSWKKRPRKPEVGPVDDDPHVRARAALVEVDGSVMQNVVARLSATPGQVRWAGRALGADDPLVP